MLTDCCDDLFAPKARLDSFPLCVSAIIVVDIIIGFQKPPSKLHQRPWTQAIEPFHTLFKPAFVYQTFQHFLRLHERQPRARAALCLLAVLRLASAFGGRFGQLPGLH